MKPKTYLLEYNQRVIDIYHNKYLLLAYMYNRQMTWHLELLLYHNVNRLLCCLLKSFQMVFDSKDFLFSQQPVDINDIRLTRVWGKSLYRISLRAKSLQGKGSYTFKFIPQ